MYRHLAHLYDWEGTLDFTERLLQKDLKTFQDAQLSPPARILDLACGTGNLSFRLAETGYDVLGIDYSNAMLDMARKKQKSAPDFVKTLQNQPQWQWGDMRAFQVQDPFNAVVCHYDSLNHLHTRQDFQSTIIQVARALKPNGLFLFDLNTLDNYRTFWNGSDTDEGPNYRLTTTTSFDDRTLTGTAHFIAQEYNEYGQLQLREDSFQVSYFPEDWVQSVLEEAQFTAIQYETFNPTDDIPEDCPLKTYWVCRLKSYN
jgi:ubiquinone/menaquinone biosynthesis C-methylase UbiE